MMAVKVRASFRTVALDEVLDLADSGTWGDEGSPTAGSPVLRSTNIQDNQLSLAEPAWRIIPENDRSRRRLLDGDIIVTKSSGSSDHIGKCAIFRDPGDGHDYYFSNFMLRLRAKTGAADPRWLFHWLTSERGRAVLHGLNSTTSGLRNLSVPLYLAQRIPLPPLPDQKRIATILDKADTVRRKRQQAIAVANYLIPSQLLDMFGDPVRNPRAWPVRRLGDLVPKDDTINYGVVQPGNDFPDGVPIVRVGDFDDMSITLNGLKRIDPAIEAQYKRSRLVGDEVLIACVGSIGMIALADERLRGFNIVRAVARVRCGPEVNRVYLAWLMMTAQIQRQFTRETRTVSQPTLNIRQIEETSIMLPPIKMQNEFAALVEKSNKYKRRLIAAVADAEALFNSLVQRAFRGDL